LPISVVLGWMRLMNEARCSFGQMHIFPIICEFKTKLNVFSSNFSDFCHFNLDPNTVNHKLVLSESDRLVTWRGGNLQYPDHRERFDSVYQVMSKESVCGRAYWEVEWINGWGVFISASYKGISRKGDVDSVFGRNDQSWSLHCSSAVTFCHNNVQVEIPVQPFSSRVGVYVDHGAGTLSFYNISNTMTPLYTIHTTFTQPLYAGFWIGSGSYLMISKMEIAKMLF
uniref:B30.2/SPRY domain-containing protein n=1 Tax=Astyanax mexicanus TaxID=7994 RepID=A0A8B9JGW5_ASTMX